jgi:hypothetical protein
MSGFDVLEQEIARGILGKNSEIPMGFKRLSKYIGIRKKIYSLIFGQTGGGKSAWVHSCYILNPFDWWISEGRKKGVKMKIPLFSMERSRVYTIAKWTARKIFLNEGIQIPIAKMLGWWDTKLTKDEHDIVLTYSDYINELLEVVDIIEGAQNPTGIYKYLKAFADSNGRVEQIDEYHPVYIPNDENLIVIPVVDHMGLTKQEGKMNTKKEAIDKLSEYLQRARDFYGYSPVLVAQLTRDLSNPLYQKQDSFEPSVDQIKESGTPGEAADVIISIFDPGRHKTNDTSGYDVKKFVDGATGANYFRSVKILKNTYGEDHIRVGMAFQGFSGTFSELPKPKDMREKGFSYEKLFDGSYFLEQSIK